MNHLLINRFTVQMGDGGHILIRSDVLQILGFVTAESSFAILAIAITISLALSFHLVVSRLVAMLRSQELS